MRKFLKLQKQHFKKMPMCAGKLHILKIIILRNGVWIDLEPVRERVLHIIEQYTDKEIKSGEDMVDHLEQEYQTMLC